MKRHQSDLLKELDSDDELPETYIDASIPPAYQNDYRFDVIKFPWLNTLERKGPELKTHSHENQQHHDDILRHEGVLKGQDLYCLKSLESCTCSTTLVWFINFLLYKDLQSHYNYLKSCLVNDLISIKPFSKNQSSHSEDNVSKGIYEIVIKV